MPRSVIRIVNSAGRLALQCERLLLWPRGIAIRRCPAQLLAQPNAGGVFPKLQPFVHAQAHINAFLALVRQGIQIVAINKCAHAFGRSAQGACQVVAVAE